MPRLFCGSMGAHFVSESDSLLLRAIQPFVVAVADKHGEGVAGGAVQDAVDVVVAGDIFYLSTAEVILLCQCLHVHVAQVGNHLMPDMCTGLHSGFLELDFVEEAALLVG